MQQLDDGAGRARFDGRVGLGFLVFGQGVAERLELGAFHQFLEVLMCVGDGLLVHGRERALNLGDQAVQIAVEVGCVALGLGVDQRASKGHGADNELAAIVGDHRGEHLSQLVRVAGQIQRLLLDGFDVVANLATVSERIHRFKLATVAALGNHGRVVFGLAAIGEGLGSFARLQFAHLLGQRGHLGLVLAFERLVLLLPIDGLFFGRSLLGRHVGGEFFRHFDGGLFRRFLGAKGHSGRFGPGVTFGGVFGRCVESAGVFVFVVEVHGFLALLSANEKSPHAEGLGSPAWAGRKKTRRSGSVQIGVSLLSRSASRSRAAATW